MQPQMPPQAPQMPQGQPQQPMQQAPQPKQQTNPNFNPNLFNGPIPGQGLTQPVGAAKWQQPPQFVHLDELLEYMWNKLVDEDMAVQIYGLLSIGVPAEAIARTILFGCFAHGICTVTLAQLAIRTVIRQVVAIGHFLGLKKMKIKNHDAKKVQQLAKLKDLMDEFGSVDDNDSKAANPATPSAGSQIFSGLGA